MISPAAAVRLVSRFSEFRNRLTAEELQHWHLMLSAMVSEIADGYQPPSSPPLVQVWQLMVQAISETYPGGVIRLGSLAPLRAAMNDLVAEATEMTEEQVRVCGATSGTVESGTLATRVAHHPLLRDELSKHAGISLHPAATVSYFYYHQPGDYLFPHADPITTSGVICLTNLVHTERTDGNRPSALIVYRPDGHLQRLELIPGESLMLFGGGTVHARETIGPGETVINLSVGFAYRDRPPSSLWDQNCPEKRNL